MALSTLALGWLSSVAPAAEPGPAPVPVPAPAHAVPVNGAKPVVVTHGGDYKSYCDQGCCEESCGGHGGRFIGGVGFYYIRPHFDNNIAFVDASLNIHEVFDPSLTVATTRRHVDFDWDEEFAPRAWIGYVNCDGLGVRGRWWRFDEEVSAHPTPFLATSTFDEVEGTLLIAGSVSATPLGIGLHLPDQIESDLELDVYDIEAIKEVNNCAWSFLFAAGIRYAELRQDYRAIRNAKTLVGTENGVEVPLFDIPAATLNSSHEFEGFGPTVAVEVRHAIGDSGLSLFTSGRGSLLYGEREHNVRLYSLDEVNDVLITADGASDSDNDLITVLELELGAEYGLDMGGSRVVLQAALVGQTWIGAGNATRSNAVNPLDLNIGLGNGGEDDCNLGFFGVTLTAGVDY
jgi:hypothetical protein